MKYIVKFELLLIALWLGASIFFSVGVAPTTFAILDSREMAGGIVNHTLTLINFSGLIIGILLLLVSFIPRNDSKKIWAWSQRFFLLIVTVACALGQLIIGFYLEHLRKLIGRPIDELAADDPLRMQFDTWHQYSVWTLITAMVAALLAFFVISRTSSSDSGAAPKVNEIPDFELPDELKM